jgi:hypothetical protein
MDPFNLHTGEFAQLLACFRVPHQSTVRASRVRQHVAASRQDRSLVGRNRGGRAISGALENEQFGLFVEMPKADRPVASRGKQPTAVGK